MARAKAAAQQQRAFEKGMASPTKTRARREDVKSPKSPRDIRSEKRKDREVINSPQTTKDPTSKRVKASEAPPSDFAAVMPLEAETAPEVADVRRDDNTGGCDTAAENNDGSQSSTVASKSAALAEDTANKTSNVEDSDDDLQIPTRRHGGVPKSQLDDDSSHESSGNSYNLIHRLINM